MSIESIFFRLLDSPIDSKGAELLQQIALQNQGEQHNRTFLVNPNAFGSITGSPFAYWVNQNVRDILSKYPPFEPSAGIARRGPSTGDDTRRLRAWWEISPDLIDRYKRWVPYPKGGNLSPYYSDIPLVVSWDENRRTFLDFFGRPGREIERPECLDDFFFSGLTWPRRASRFAPSAMPEGCVFSVRGQAVLATVDRLPMLLGTLNSNTFDFIFKLSLGRWGFPEFIAGVLQRLPWAEPKEKEYTIISELSIRCYENRRNIASFNEVTHVFSLPIVLGDFVLKEVLKNRLNKIANEVTRNNQQFQITHDEIDHIVADLYGLDQEYITSLSTIDDAQVEDEYEDGEIEEEANNESQNVDPISIVSNQLMWSLGVVFGRWDARFALQPDLLPALAGPFDPLPRCSPGMLLSPNGFPATKGNIVSEAWLRARPDVLTLPQAVDGPETISDQEYPLPIAWDGILVDEPDHDRDIVTAVRRVLRLIWKEQADAIEKEACQILKVPDLRSYFRDPRLFFNFHIKRYSKSRRKAPIYWLLQSAKRNYGIWFYYPRLNPDMLFTAGREYVDAKLNLETSRLKELQTNLTGLTGTNLKTRERQVARQADLIEELKAFGKELDRVALLELKPDLNDGVLLNIAPLYNLVPWKEAEKAWKELVSGKYEWSSIEQQLRQKGWVKK